MLAMQRILCCRDFTSSLSSLLLVTALLSVAAAGIKPSDDTPPQSNIEFALPHVHYDIATSELWRCSTANIGDEEVRTLTSIGHLYQFEILKHGKSWVDLLTAQNSMNALRSLGLTECNPLTSLKDLLANELQQNWGTLQHHSLHPSWQNEPSRAVSLATRESLGGNLEIIEDSTEDWKTVNLQRHSVLKRDTGNEDETSEKCKGADNCGKQGEDGGSGMDRSDNDWFVQYHNFSEIYNWFYQLAEDHPDMVFLNRSIGKTHYDRDILAVHFTERRRAEEIRLRKPKIYFQCLLHPREWISGSVCMYLAKNLASPHSHPMLTELLSQIEFVMVPVANPDGYYLTWFQYPKFRLWRKNVQPFDDSICAGVDLNRNFNVSNWDQEAESSSSDHCSELYRGPSSASEREVSAISRYFESLSPVIGAIDFHSYHQEVLYPPASTYDVPDEVVDTLDRVAKAVASRASEVGVAYSSRKMIDVYSATGTFADWMLLQSLSGVREKECLIPLTIELRPTFDMKKGVYHGFLLPASQILPACQEMLAAVIKFAQLAHEHSTTCLSRP